MSTNSFHRLQFVNKKQKKNKKTKIKKKSKKNQKKIKKIDNFLFNFMIGIQHNFKKHKFKIQNAAH